MDERPIRTALLSYGMSGQVFHGPLLRAHSGFVIDAVFHRSKKDPPPHAYRVVTSSNEIFDDPEIELVIVNTPNETHFQYAEQALLSGKHVIVEKPFTVTVVEADTLISLAKKHNRMLTVFQNRRWDGDFLTVKEVLSSNALGKVVEFEAHYDRFRNVVDTQSWKEVSMPGTGVLYNLGSHMIDQVLMLFGLPQFVDARMGIHRPGARVYDYYDLRLSYPGLLVILKSSYLVKEAGPRYIVHGTEGSFVKFGIDPQEEDLKTGRDPESKGWGKEPKEMWGQLNTTSSNGPVMTLAGNYQAFYDNVFDVLRHGGSVAVRPEEARDVIRVIEACYRSNDSRCAVLL